ncbi:hypothetical protein BSL78_08111 [Apostichopus japonicus]|uniref:Reverse transcriptase domain-containing protein n=1 Tax=Stichopus japonicus TaxID=307972 RepID=A0A2G8L401_STIJA|nr:hypothetical protein BSL78_08111 [Apostichopus japonicus]
MSDLLNKHAPLSTKRVVIRPKQPWFTNSLHSAKRNRRKAERKWISSRSLIDFDKFKKERNSYNIQLYRSKCTFLNNKIMDCGNDFKSMFRTINDILQRKRPTKLPDHDSAKDLADQFAAYFSTKIQTIRDNLTCQNCDSSTPSPVSHSWDTFVIVSEDDLREIISKAASPSCILDPLPSWMVKLLLDSLLPTVTEIVNTSLRSGVVPDTYKEAVIAPLLKKANLDHNTLKNYRPVSNLPFLSKVLERVVAKQLTNYMTENRLHEPLQSAYKQFHSSETALIKVHNDILWAMERQGVTILVLLDLSSAFDTIDLEVLIHRLEYLLGVHGIPLTWFKSYLSDRSHRVLVDGKFSSVQNLVYGVPQDRCWVICCSPFTFCLSEILFANMG